MEWFRRALRASGWGVAGLAFAAIIAQVDSSPGAFIASVQALTPWFFLVVAFAFAVGLWKDRRAAVANLIALVALGIWLLPLVTAPSGPSAAPTATEVRVASVNLLDDNQSIDAAVDDAIGQRPDIVGFVEVTKRIGDLLAAHPFSDSYPYQVSVAGAGPKSGRTLWSRYPIEREASNVGDEYILTAVAQTPDGPLRIVLVHILSPFKGNQVWFRELSQLPDLVAASELPTVVMGDFNASYTHPPFRSMVEKADLLDGLPAAGKRFTMTWPNDTFVWPFVALDHVLVGPNVAVTDADAFGVTGSDHMGVTATVAITNEPSAGAPGGSS